MKDTRDGMPVTGSEPHGKRNKGWPVRLAQIALIILAPVLLLLLVEGALRVFNVGYSTELMEPRSVHGQPSSCYNLFFNAPFFPPGVIRSPTFFCMSPQKAKNTYRIVILGESAAAGDPDAAYSFGRYLQKMLGERFPATKIEVINMGAVAINSHVSLIMARELAKYEPDLFLVYAGSNEVVGPYGPGTVLSSSSLSMPVIRASILARSSRIGQLLTSGGQKGEWRGMEMFVDKQVRADSPRLQPAYRNFSSNLRNIVEIARASGAHVILSTVATNLRDCSPFKSLHKTSLNDQQLQAWSSFVEQGNSLAAEGNCLAALAAYSSAEKIDDQYADLEFRMARCYEALANLKAAQDHYVRAGDLDTLRFRADSQINEIIRKVATTSGPDVQLLDAQALFAARSRDGVIGSELLYDHVHFTPLANYLFARAAFGEIMSFWPSTDHVPDRSIEPPSEAECERLLALTEFDRVRLDREMLDRLQRPPFTTQLTHMEQLQGLMLSANAPTGSVQDAIAQYQWAISQHPDDLMLHYKFGYFLFNFNRAAAAQELILARPNDEFPVTLPDGTRIL